MKVDMRDWKKKLGCYKYFCGDGVVRKWDGSEGGWREATEEEQTIRLVED